MTRTNQDIATELFNASQKAIGIKQFPEIETVDQAYEIQQIGADLKVQSNDRVVGFKLGFTGNAKRKEMGVSDVIWGRLYESMNSDTNIDLNGFIRPKVEPELAFRVSKRIAQPLTLNEVPEYIDSFCPAIEIADSRYINLQFDLPSIIADNSFGAGYLLSSWRPLQSNLNSFQVNVLQGNQLKHTGNSSSIMGNPLESVCSLSRLVCSKGIVIEAGQIILAGAMTPAIFLEKDEVVRMDFEKLGVLTLMPK